MNIVAIYTAQQVLDDHDRLRERLHDIKAIIPDDQRIISDIHKKICSTITMPNNQVLQNFEINFIHVKTLLEEYKDAQAVEDYLSHCLAIIDIAIELFETENSKGIDPILSSSP